MKLPANILENVPLAPLTTFGIGGPARFFVEATTQQQVVDALTFSADNSLPLFVLGGGSNLLVADSGYEGLVLKVALRGIQEAQAEQAGAKRIFNVAAGEDWDSFVALTVARNCAGVETLSGIPGSVGGTPVQNVGAYGQEVSETITNVRVLDISSHQVRDLTNADCGFAYRSSIFNSRARGKFIVLGVTYALTPAGQAKIAYADLKRHFADHSGTPSLEDVRDAVRQIRHSKGMLIVEGDPDCRSAGSFFKNPIVTETVYEDVVLRAQRLNIAGVPPKYPAGVAGCVKLSAAWLVEHSGFPKGFTKGKAAISSKHTLALMNRGGASAADILALKQEVQSGVQEKFGVELVPEPVFLGF